MIITSGAVTSGTFMEGPGSVGTRIVEHDYPYDEGLIAGVTKQEDSPNLEEE